MNFKRFLCLDSVSLVALDGEAALTVTAAYWYKTLWFLQVRMYGSSFRCARSVIAPFWLVCDRNDRKNW